ncbi:MAG: N-acetylmuramoyl-L-alanine amidase [Fimbriimonadaceae bacterium]
MPMVKSALCGLLSVLGCVGLVGAQEYAGASQPAGAWREPGYNRIAWEPSPHFAPRSFDIVVDTVVLHHTANNSLEGVVRWFQSPNSRVSAHFTVGKDGSIVQHVSTFDRAWHAGPSRDHLGRTSLNNFSIGIEMVNLGDGKDPWTKEQVEVVGFLIGHLKRRFPIKYIVSHEYIAVPTGRKIDPKNFPWDALRYLGLELIYGRPNPPFTADPRD